MIKSWEKKVLSEVEKNDMISKLEKHFGNILDDMGFDRKNDVNLIDTPRRIAKMYVNDLCSGNYNESPKITTFDSAAMNLNTEDENEQYTSNIVNVGPIRIKSLCSHHFLPFIGHCFIQIEPGRKLIGLSKLPRIVQDLMRRPHIQENLTHLIIQEILKKLSDVKGIATYIKAQHLCMAIRGVNEDNGHMVTYKGYGTYSDKNKINQFIDYCERSSITL